MLNLLKAKIESYANKIEAANSSCNFLSQVKAELESIYNDFTNAAPVVESVVNIVDPSIAPVVDGTVNAIESVVNA